METLNEMTQFSLENETAYGFGMTWETFFFLVKYYF